MIDVPESHRDLIESQVAVLATVGSDGLPQVSAIWFLAQGDTVRASLNTSRQKVKNLARDPSCCLFILDLANPYRYLELRGTASLEPDPDYDFADRVGAKYHADLREHDQPGDTRVVVTFEPSTVNAVDMSG